MNIASLMVLTCVLCFVVLVAQEATRLFPAIGLVAAALEALIAFKLIKLSTGHINLGLILAVTLALAAVASWTKASSKTAVSAATAAAVIGAIQVAGFLLAG